MSNNRTDILEAAAQVFSRKGFHGASMQDIANALGIKKASLYHHIASKQEILSELLDQALDLLTGEIGALVGEEGAAAERLRKAMRAYVRTLADHRQL
ncbi:MAG: TetR/AcrR family transcriptional regulator, partial [Anaerolineae bacterium]